MHVRVRACVCLQVMEMATVISCGASLKSKELWMMMLQKVSPGSGPCPGPGPELKCPQGSSSPPPSSAGHSPRVLTRNSPKEGRFDPFGERFCVVLLPTQR